MGCKDCRYVEAENSKLRYMVERLKNLIEMDPEMILRVKPVLVEADELLTNAERTKEAK